MRLISHIRPSDQAEQPLRSHLHAVSAYSGRFAAAANLKVCGMLIGLLHDLGKFSEAFQKYIRNKTTDAETLESDDSNPNPTDKHRVNHSAAGAQRLFELLRESIPAKTLSGGLPLFDLLASAILSHHNPAGLVDFISSDGGQEPFAKRLTRAPIYTHLPEIREHLLIHPKQIVRACRELATISKNIKTAAGQNKCEYLLQHLLLEKFLYSCLIDADRTDSADFEHPRNKKVRRLRIPVDWPALHARFEKKYIEKFGTADDGNDHIVRTRRAISEACLARADTPPGIYRLPVPTGGGKTLASLRFALAHAASRQDTAAPIRHIIYVLPFTTILVQNANQARDFIGPENVLEHHANLLPTQVDRRQLLLSENWDAPVIFTTTVQFLNAFYSDSKEAQRRMHQAASSVLIFDEAQALPIKTLHLFNHALSFLTRHTSATAVICTATPPLLDNLDSRYGRLTFSPNANLTEGISFAALSNRTRIIDKRKSGGSEWTCAELCQILEIPIVSKNHVLVIVNTKDQAQKLYDACNRHFDHRGVKVTHLSNNLCPAHLRKTISHFRLQRRRKKGKAATLLCIATSLVEAGVDLDFDLVVRDIAGFVSLVQAAGRCNRHGHRATSDLWVINLERAHGRPGLDEEVSAANRVLREMMGTSRTLPLNDEYVSRSVESYFKYYYHEKKEQMRYPITKPYRTDIIDLLTENTLAVEECYRQNERLAPDTRMHAAPASAAQLFEVIDSNTHSVIVPYSEQGKQIIGEFCEAFQTSGGVIADAGKLLAKARPFTVNVYENDWQGLYAAHALHEVQNGAGIYYLDGRHYHPEKGVTLEESASMQPLMA